MLHQFLTRRHRQIVAEPVAEFGEHSPSALQSERARANERAGFLAHEMRNLLNTAVLAFEVLKRGNIGVAGSTGAVLQRSLMGARAQADRSLADVRLAHAVQNPEPFAMAAFIDDLTAAAVIEANVRGVQLRVAPVDHEMIVEADRQVLTAVVMNLLQNAFKFTHPGTAVDLRVRASAGRVLIEVEDECGGLPAGNAVELFKPFKQRGRDRTGLGLGLAFSHWGVEANHGRLYARSLINKGCVFTVDLPRLAAGFSAAVAAAR